MRSSVLVAAVGTVAGFAIGEFPTQTVGGFGAPFLPEVTAAPQRDLVKARLEKKALTNTCTECKWLISHNTSLLLRNHHRKLDNKTEALEVVRVELRLSSVTILRYTRHLLIYQISILTRSS